MEIAKTYDPTIVEGKWYQYWLDHQLFASRPDPAKEPYTIVIPPPNVTGLLHMGHMLNNTIQDILIRRARMQGKEACWVPGMDHASIATEAKVVAMLKERGIDKKSLSRGEFLAYAWEWKQKYGGLILEQLKKLGASCDWGRTRFTMEDSLSEAVTGVFVDLYNKGKIYRAYRMVNWDPKGKTALSDEEVVYKEVQSKLYYVRYQIVPENSILGNGQTPHPEIVIATTRPETILADTAICVNPDDGRYRHLHGRMALVPFTNRQIPIITDEYVAMDFGTGGLKVTPAHDLNDYELGKKHNLPVIDILNDDGTLNDKCGVPEYTGKDRFVVRREIAKDLEAAGLLEKTEEYRSNVGYSERNPDTVVEPKVSLQWWLKMDGLAKPALEHVLDDTVRFHPDKFKNMYRHWMENVHDWCISRQLWWGQRIPAWYDETGDFVVARTEAEAVEMFRIRNPDFAAQNLRQDEDVLDTWFSAWLWPISVFDGFKDPGNADISYYYPTNTLVTGPDIIFFWVARMVMAGYEFRHELPFRDVYFTGIIRDQYGRKMSKQLGNSPDPIGLMDRYGADGVRTGLLFSSPAGNDLIFDTPVPKSNKPDDITEFLKTNDPLESKLCEQGRNFNNKMWNAFRLIKNWQEAPQQPPPTPSERGGFQAPPSGEGGASVAIRWFGARFQVALAELEDHFGKFRISDALHTVYDLAWDDFCSWYLEMVKPEFGQPISREAYAATVGFFDQLLRVLHPFMPFVTEEIWQGLEPRQPGESICVAEYPKAGSGFEKGTILEEASLAFEVVRQIRNLRNGQGMSPKVTLELLVYTPDASAYESFGSVIRKLANVSAIHVSGLAGVNGLAGSPPERKHEGRTGTGFLIKSDEFFVPLNTTVDAAKERQRLQKELDHQTGFLESVDKKLGNEKFVANAKPEIIENERRKKADAEAKIKSLQESLKNLDG